MIARERLPDRRPNTSRNIEWHGSKWTVTVGWNHAGRVQEIFLKGAKMGTHMEVAAEDDCFIVSRLLQRGESISDLSASLLLHRPLRAEGDCDTGSVLPSLIAVAIAAAAKIEEEDGSAMARLLLCTAPAEEDRDGH